MMKRTSLFTMMALAALAVTSLGTGCIEDDRSFFIRQNQIPQSGCIVTSTTTLYNPRGTLDVSGGQGYWLYPLMENNFSSSKSGDNQPERNGLHLRGYEVEIDLGQIPGSYPSDLLDFYEPTTGNIPPSTKAWGMVKVIPDRLVKLMNIPASVGKVLVMVSVRALAKKSGADVESSTFVYPIDLCNGCLVDHQDPCPDTTSTTTTTTTILRNACGTPQDTPVTCCSKTAGTYCFQTANK